MDILRSLFPENCFDNDIIIAHNLFMKENESKIINFLEKHDNNLTKIFIDNILHLIYQDYEQFRLIHYICFHSTPEMIKYIIDKSVDLECANFNKWRPIHHICRYSTPEMIKYLVDYGVNLNVKNAEGGLPIDYIEDEEMKAYVHVHMNYQLANANELYMNGYKMALRKLFNNPIKSARK